MEKNQKLLISVLCVMGLGFAQVVWGIGEFDELGNEDEMDRQQAKNQNPSTEVQRQTQSALDNNRSQRNQARTQATEAERQRLRDFDKLSVAGQARALWNKKVSPIEIATGSPDPDVVSKARQQAATKTFQEQYPKEQHPELYEQPDITEDEWAIINKPMDQQEFSNKVRMATAEQAEKSIKQRPLREEMNREEYDRGKITSESQGQLDEIKKSMENDRKVVDAKLSAQQMIKEFFAVMPSNIKESLKTLGLPQSDTVKEMPSVQEIERIFNAKLSGLQVSTVADQQQRTELSNARDSLIRYRELYPNMEYRLPRLIEELGVGPVKRLLETKDLRKLNWNFPPRPW